MTLSPAAPADKGLPEEGGGLERELTSTCTSGDESGVESCTETLMCVFDKKQTSPDSIAFPDLKNIKSCFRCLVK